MWKTIPRVITTPKLFVNGGTMTKQASINGLNPPYTVKIELPKNNVVGQYKGILSKLFPELKDVQKEDLKR